MAHAQPPQLHRWTGPHSAVFWPTPSFEAPVKLEDYTTKPVIVTAPHLQGLLPTMPKCPFCLYGDGCVSEPPLGEERGEDTRGGDQQREEKAVASSPQQPASTVGTLRPKGWAPPRHVHGLSRSFVGLQYLYMSDRGSRAKLTCFQV